MTAVFSVSSSVSAPSGSIGCLVSETNDATNTFAVFLSTWVDLGVDLDIDQIIWGAGDFIFPLPNPGTFKGSCFAVDSNADSVTGITIALAKLTMIQVDTSL